ncbi:unnamed protein product [Prorocentrum cordatum]|uniref:FAD/NAD(P)-binding domain-containing protein n=1 Tax=Prorocentrum cordatum TaxID=2364126 RepID=A0ABN9Q415_9DINO|nr:unnamed protein product [Polarella glacialis]
MSSKVTADPAGHGIVIIGGGIAFLHAVKVATKRKCKVTAVCSNPFLEWPVSATLSLTRPGEHEKWLCQNPEDFTVNGVEYIFDAVTKISPAEKTIQFMKSPQITYGAVVVATGNRLPLLMPVPGESLEARKALVREAVAAVKAAKTIVINGAGLVGLEMAGDAKVANQAARVVLLSRSGELLVGSHPGEWQRRVKAKAQELGVEVVKGTVTSAGAEDFKLTPCTLALADSAQDTLACDVYIPSYMQGPNTAFLAGAAGVLNEKGQVVVNECLQSVAWPEIFAAGVSTVPYKHPNSQGAVDHAAHAVSGAVALLEGRPTSPFKNSGLERSMNVVVAHGAGGYLFWDLEAFPAPVKCCCCLWCGGGFPCCPPPCCWCCGPGCPTLCGHCCGGSGHSEGAAAFHERVMLKKFAGMRGYAGMGSAGSAPAQQQMK